jgi:uncharacterized protein YjiS (DUF1127 family)
MTITSLKHNFCLIEKKVSQQSIAKLFLCKAEQFIKRHHTRHILQNLTEAQLNDVGLYRHDVLTGYRKPF